MGTNVEIKARTRDFEGVRRTAAGLAAGNEELIKQEDTFFQVARGRLKLRAFSAEVGELIYYERPDGRAPKESQYLITRTHDPESLKATLAAALGIRGVVRKTRRLFLVGQTRIHLDEVEGLGRFVELEVVMKDGQTAEEGERIARDLMKRLGVRETDLLESAYIDLLESAR